MSFNSTWIFEVLEFITERDGDIGWIALGGKLKHVGYMKAKFKTRADACTYYDRNNPHMRPLNKHGTYKSDWDPETRLIYIVRKDYHCIETIEPFSEGDSTGVDRGVFSVYNYMK